MPIITEETIERISRGVLRAAGATDEHAKTVAHHLADANLAGHDSHGFIRIPQYVRDIREGRLDPVAQSEVVGEHMAMGQVNGNGTFGQVVAAFATRLAMKKAREYGIGLVTMYNLGHTGRVGTYPEMAAKEGMAAIMYSGGIARGQGGVAPFGGREGRLSTNPISMAFTVDRYRVTLGSSSRLTYSSLTSDFSRGVRNALSPTKAGLGFVQPPPPNDGQAGGPLVKKQVQGRQIRDERALKLVVLHGGVVVIDQVYAITLERVVFFDIAP